MIEPRLAGVAAFPQDLRAEHGFDNQADHLSLSPLLMESFLKLGRSITESPDFGPRNVGIWKSFFLDPAAEVDATAEARRRLAPFLTRAFRRPVDDAVLERYTAFVSQQLADGHRFTEAMKSAAAAAIASPRFLYLYDRPAAAPSGAGVTEAIDDYELASRLSFFLWGSLPDQRLLDLAAAGTLGEAEVLESEVGRLLRDKKLKRFCDSFPAQWLQLERIISSIPNEEKFPGFYFSKYRDSMHMMLEPLLLFETVLIENRSILQLIDPDFTYRSRLLQEAYGELATGGLPKAKAGDAVGALKFERVPVSDRRSGGVITNAAVMTMTSGPERTQPITRGAWIAGVIFNDPPEPPPADVPPLGEKPAAGEEHLTLRERLSLHRQRADCRGCHEQIDPLGFALENYDPVGRWRDHYDNDREVDMSGELFRKHPFSDVIGFKDAILAERQRFARGLAGHLLAFALARELSPADQIALDQITEAAAADDYKIHTLIRQIITQRAIPEQNQPGVRTVVTGSNPPPADAYYQEESHGKHTTHLPPRPRRGCPRAPRPREPRAQRPGESRQAIAQRMAHFYVPIGVVRRGFFPGEADDIIPKGNLGNVMKSLGKQDPEFKLRPLEELTPTLQPLAAIKGKVNLITGMDRTFQNGTDVHAQCACCYLSSAEPYSISQSVWPLDRTLDHIVADQIGSQTPFPHPRVQLQHAQGQQGVDLLRQHLLVWHRPPRPLDPRPAQDVSPPLLHPGEPAVPRRHRPGPRRCPLDAERPRLQRSARSSPSISTRCARSRRRWIASRR